MGVNISDIIPKREISMKELQGKVIAIDAFNTLYQFLTSIKQPDGTPLMDSNGNITSHLSGLFYRNIHLLTDGIRPVYVFDGKPPKLKEAELKKRKENKLLAEGKFEAAKSAGDREGMEKYSGRFVKITDEIIQESKDLLIALGIPVIQAPGEGEAEAAVLARKKKVWASASQDFDSILYGAPYLIRNLTLARRRKTSSGLYIDINPEMIEFERVLDELKITKDQLICLAILIGTDYNPGGVKGLGQKRALEIVQRISDPKEIFKEVEDSDRYELTFNWEEIFKQFHEYESIEEDIVFNNIDEEKVRALLLKHDFSENRIDSGLEKLRKLKESKKQKGLGDFF